MEQDTVRCEAYYTQKPFILFLYATNVIKFVNVFGPFLFCETSLTLAHQPNNPRRDPHRTRKKEVKDHIHQEDGTCTRWGETEHLCTLCVVVIRLSNSPMSYVYPGGRRKKWILSPAILLVSLAKYPCISYLLWVVCSEEYRTCPRGWPPQPAHPGSPLSPGTPPDSNPLLLILILYIVQ